MSFISTGVKPKLVENKVVEKIIKVQHENKPYNFQIWKYVSTFIINNLFVVSIFVFIFILLIYRYFDVQSRKKHKITKDEEQDVKHDENEDLYDEEDE
jgi:hypothetical protein